MLYDAALRKDFLKKSYFSASHESAFDILFIAIQMAARWQRQKKSKEEKQARKPGIL